MAHSILAFSVFTTSILSVLIGTAPCHHDYSFLVAIFKIYNPNLDSTPHESIKVASFSLFYLHFVVFRPSMLRGGTPTSPFHVDYFHLVGNADGLIAVFSVYHDHLFHSNKLISAGFRFSSCKQR